MLQVQVGYRALLSVWQPYMGLLSSTKASFLLLQGLVLVVLAEAYMGVLLSGRKVILILKNLKMLRM